MSEKSNWLLLKSFGIVFCMAIGMVLFFNQYAKSDDRAAEKAKRVNTLAKDIFNPLVSPDKVREDINAIVEMDFPKTRKPTRHASSSGTVYSSSNQNARPGQSSGRSSAGTAPKEDNRLGIVLDSERPSNTDIILLRNGDKLTGTILNNSFSIRTSYAKIKLNNRSIAGIDLEGGKNNIEAIITVNNNRFSGFIDDPLFVFKLQSGAKIKVRREKVLKVIFRVREAERRGMPQRQFIVLKNGDYFSGKITNDKIVIGTTYAKIPLNLANVESIRLIGGDTPLTKVKMLNGDLLQGVLQTEDIALDLDVGSKAKIYQDRMEIIYCQYGFIPPDHAYIAQRRAMEDTSGYSATSVASELEEIDRNDRFVAYANGTVKDTRTGLMWASKDNGDNINWPDAKRYCEDYQGGGHTDWRMPRLDELNGIYDANETNDHDFYVTRFIGISACCPWASETRDSEAASFGFATGTGGPAWYHQFNGVSGRALPVRGGN